jgi:hypothetical protein
MSNVNGFQLVVVKTQVIAWRFHSQMSVY